MAELIKGVTIGYGTNKVKTIVRRLQGMHTVGAASKSTRAPLLPNKVSFESAKRHDQLPPERMGVSLSNNIPSSTFFRHFSFFASFAAAFNTLFCSCAPQVGLGVALAVRRGWGALDRGA
jgi:hypothetical protein